MFSKFSNHFPVLPFYIDVKHIKKILKNLKRENIAQLINVLQDELINNSLIYLLIRN